MFVELVLHVCLKAFAYYFQELFGTRCILGSCEVICCCQSFEFPALSSECLLKQLMKEAIFEEVVWKS